jgi:DNA-binding response OmpR family regulator
MEFRAKKHLWILENDSSARFIYDEILGIRYRLRFFSDVQEFREAACTDSRPDLLIADLRMPGESFLDFIENQKEIGGNSLSFPFIVISAVDDTDILRYCFKEGALDYLTKPFKTNELIVKLERLLSVYEQVPDEESQAEDIVLDSSTLRIRKEKSDGGHVQLTAKEHQIFSLLYHNRAKKTSREDLVKHVWEDVRVGGKTLDVHLFNLRKKISALDLEVKFFSPNYFQLCRKVEKDPGLENECLTHESP